MNALEEYLNTASGMTLLATQQDDQTVTCKGAEWFKYNGVTANNLYISGNSWIGFGASSEQMKICRRDAKCHNLYRQEIAFPMCNCIKYRWDGYSVYNSTTAANKLTWELFIFDNNDIFLNCISVPTNGTNSFDLLGGTGTFDPQTGKQLSMYCQDTENGKIFNLVEGMYVKTEIDIRYLLKDDNGLYCVNEDNSSLIKLEETELSSSLFMAKGMLDIPNGNFMKELVKPKLLEWHSRIDVSIKLNATVTALPNHQLIVQNYDSYYNDETIKGINYVEVLGTINDSATVRFAVTFNNIDYYTYLNDEWITVDINDFDVFVRDGMTKEMLESLTKEQLESIFLIQEVYKFRFAVLIDYTDINAIANIEQIKVDFEN